MAPKLVLSYFDFAGTAESVRWALEQSGLEWEDKRLSGEEFAALKPSEWKCASSPYLAHFSQHVSGRKLASSSCLHGFHAARGTGTKVVLQLVQLLKACRCSGALLYVTCGVWYLVFFEFSALTILSAYS